MSFLYHPLVLSLVIGLATFICSYRWSSKVLDFFAQKTLGSQEEILDIMDRLLMTQERKKIVLQCWTVSISFSLLAFLLFWPQVLLSLISAGSVLILTWVGIKKLLQRVWERHCDRVVDQMVEALTIMYNSIKVGLGLTQAMERVILGYPGPLAKEFQLALNKVKLGQGIEEALTEMGARVQRSDIDMLVSAINILKETGGNLGETFFVMAETIRERQKMEKKIKALTAQGMAQAKIISAMPFCFLLLFWFVDKDYILPLFVKPLGWVCLAFVVLLVAVGSVSMKKMVEIKV